MSTPPRNDDENSAPRAGEPAGTAIPKLVEAEGGRLYGLGLRLCGGPDAAEDLVQEVFLEALKSWDRFEGRSSPRTWLYTIAAHACQRLQRKKAGEPDTVASFDELLPISAATMVDVESLLVNDDSDLHREAVEAAVASLPDDFRLPLVLKDIVGFTIEDVARVLGLKEATVKTRVHRARLKIRSMLEASLPQCPSTPLAYDRQVCLDLLQAKQEALDRAVEFPMESIVCERCRSLFTTLDLAGEVCRDLGRGKLPGELRERLLRRIA